METTLELPISVENAEAKADSPAMSGSESVKPIDLYAEHAKEKAGLPANWRIYQWSCFPKDGSETIYVAVTGAVCEHKRMTGPRKGETNWKLLDKATEKTVNLPVAEHEQWKLEWEKRTGKCSRCTGTGEVMESWDHIKGTKMRTCPKCKGARTPNVEASEPPTRDVNRDSGTGCANGGSLR